MKYNWSVIGHEKQLQMIEHDIESGNLSHAYLLVGPNSIGKHTVSKKMAGILQCENDFCHKCDTCLQVKKGSHIDTIELVDNGDSLKVGEIRTLIDTLQLTRQAKYKVVIIQGLERMTTEAANSFLKTLEEPPPRTVFILTCDHLKSLLSTIVSRVRILKFGVFSLGYLEEKLRELYPNRDQKEIEQASIFSLGRSGKAIHLMENADSLANHIKVYHDIQNFLAGKSIVDRFSYVEDIASGELKIDMFFNILKNILRSKILEKDENIERHINTLSKIDDAGILLKQNINNRLVLENLMLSI